MLSKISIENVAVIERADLEFHSGFNVLTGETGAGKSIIIDALSAVLGERTTKDIIRSGEDYARISAIFSNLSNSTLNSLNELGFTPEDDGTLYLQRQISIDGKNTCYIGNRSVTVGILREVGRLLVNTHGQHENQTLLIADKHVDYLDKLGNHLDVRKEYEDSYHEYCRIHREIKKLQTNEDDKERRIDLLKYQINEIEEINPVIGEEEKISDKCLFYKNSENISDALNKTELALSSSDQKESVSQRIQSAITYLKTISDKYSSIQPTLDKLFNVLSEFEECENEIQSLLSNLSINEEERDELEERLSNIHRLQKKYGPSEQDVLDFLSNAREELSSIEHSDERIRELEIELEKAQDIMVAAAEKLSNARKKAADYFVESVGKELSYLDMPGVTLDVQITPAPLTVIGAEKIEFCISANPGEPAKSIAKIASGGELSRIMLAIKSVLSSIDEIDTLIFDEIDNGISGHAAQKVGNKLRQIAESNDNSKQVLCVTHLAQIAAQGHCHLLIEKQIRDNRTYTTIHPLDEMGRRRELARIISGEITTSAIDAADEMLSRYKTM